MTQAFLAAEQRRLQPPDDDEPPTCSGHCYGCARLARRDCCAPDSLTDYLIDRKKGDRR